MLHDSPERQRIAGGRLTTLSPSPIPPRNRNADVLHRFQIDDELEFDRRLEGNISCFLCRRGIV
jgi:hypothetical protein